jgi:hypothetical protein
MTPSYAPEPARQTAMPASVLTPLPTWFVRDPVSGPAFSAYCSRVTGGGWNMCTRDLQLLLSGADRLLHWG